MVVDTEREIIITGSSDMSIRLWLYNSKIAVTGDYLGTFSIWGGRQWVLSAADGDATEKEALAEFTSRAAKTPVPEDVRNASRQASALARAGTASGERSASAAYSCRTSEPASARHFVSAGTAGSKCSPSTSKSTKRG